MNNDRSRTAHILLSAAKVTSVAAIALVTALFVSGRVASPLGGTVEATFATVVRCILVVLALLGLVLGWKWPVGSGATTLGAIVLVYILDLVSVSTVATDWVLPLAAVSGALFLAGGLSLKNAQPEPMTP